MAVNSLGEARQRVRLDESRYPHFLENLDVATWMMRKSGKLECRVEGIPYPDIKWYKDWQPLAESSRVRVKFEKYFFLQSFEV